MKFSEPPELQNESDDKSSNFKSLFSVWFLSVKKGVLYLFGNVEKAILAIFEKMNDCQRPHFYPYYARIVSKKCARTPQASLFLCLTE